MLETTSLVMLTFLKTNVDDVSPEILSYTVSRLMEEGAYDVSAIPCTMKKDDLGT